MFCIICRCFQCIYFVRENHCEYHGSIFILFLVGEQLICINNTMSFHL